MTAALLDGKRVAGQVRRDVAERAARLKASTGVTPALAALIVGDNPGSQVYVRMKRRACEEVGIEAETFNLGQDATGEEVGEWVRRANANPRFHGILVQLPLPAQVDEGQVLRQLDPAKDVDGLHPENVGRLALGQPRFVPCTPGGIQELLLRTGHSPEGKKVVVCGRSQIVGTPVALLLMHKRSGANATVTVCHTGTRDLAATTRQAEVLIVAMGRPRAITGDMVGEGAVVVDVGVNRVDDPSRERGYRLEGDVDFDSVAERASAITPVPGGVGPMTVAMLTRNTLLAAERLATPVGAR